MKVKFANRIEKLQASKTMALDVQAKKLQQQGINVINLTAGEPDFETPSSIKQAGIQAIEQGYTRYTNPQGIEQLRAAVVKKLKRDNNLHVTSDEIVIGAGSKQVLYCALQVLCDKDDEVIIALPTYTTFIEQTKLAGGKPVLVPLQSPFKLTANDLKKAITAQTKIIILNSPANPTGALIEKEELEKIAELVVKHNLFVITDEIYEKFVYTGKHISIASLNKEIKKRTITINGVSKTYAMTGWRIGYAAGPKEIIQKMTALQSQLLSSVNTVAQKAACFALTEKQTDLQEMIHAFRERRDFLTKELAKIKEISFIQPEGAFYVFVSIEKLLGKKYQTASKWCEALLKKEHVAVVPGEAFYYPGYFRLSFAASMEDLQEAVQRIKKFMVE